MFVGCYLSHKYVSLMLLEGVNFHCVAAVLRRPVGPPPDLMTWALLTFFQAFITIEQSG